MAYHRQPVKVLVPAKNIQYPNDGTGRDTYVSRTNGGFLSQKLLQNLYLPKADDTVKMHFLTASTSNLKKQYSNKNNQVRMQKYHGDGSGRDFFIIANDGGQCCPYQWQDQGDRMFQSGLRNYEKSRPQSAIQTNPKLRRAQSATHLLQNLQKTRLAQPKRILRPNKTMFAPDLTFAHKLYKSYQTLEFQTKAKLFD